MTRNSFQGIIEKVSITKFRKFHNLNFSFGKKVTALVGQNGTMKTTLLGIIAQPFSMYYNPEDPTIPTSLKSFLDCRTLDGYKFESKFADKFKFDDNHEAAGDHLYTLYFHDKSFVPNGEFSLKSIHRKSKEASGIRLWSTKGRSQGDGYIHYPVIYLSLKRVSPIGEEKKISINPQQIPEYLQLFSQLSREILISSEQYNVLDSIKSSNKSTMVAHPDSYGAQTISAGQDNIGKILTALLSFKKLKDEHPNEYKGGLLFIDELDATLYPAAQKKLIEKLFRLSSDYKVQIVFTTHSPIVITTLFDKKYINDSKVIFLKEYSETISCEENLSLEQIEAKLNVSVLQKAKKSDKLRVYTEDEEARIFLKTLLPKKYLSKLEILKINLGSEELLSLANSRKVPEFLNNMIVLDGDKTIDKKHKNILCLPGKNANSPDNYSVGPDHLIYDYLKSLSSDDDFWPGNIYTGEYDKQFCFSNFLDIDPKAPQSRNLYKQWFKEQEPHWGSLKNKPFKQWKNDNPAQTSKFIESFIKVYNYLAIKNHLEPIK